MFEAVAHEFPFVDDLPKREKSRWAKLWEQFQTARALTAEHGIILPQAAAAQLLGVSRQRVFQLVEEGRLQTLELAGCRYVTEKSIIAHAEAERRSGVHLNPTSPTECAKRAVAAGREHISKKTRA